MAEMPTVDLSSAKKGRAGFVVNTEKGAVPREGVEAEKGSDAGPVVELRPQRPLGTRSRFWA
jgi:hypothetical protein